MESIASLKLEELFAPANAAFSAQTRSRSGVEFPASRRETPRHKPMEKYQWVYY